MWKANMGGNKYSVNFYMQDPVQTSFCKGVAEK